MSKEEAVAKARKEFGNVTVIKQTAREAWGWKWIEDFFVDLRFGAADVAEESGADIGGGVDAGAGGWCEHGDFHAAVWTGAAEFAGARSNATCKGGDS